MFIAGAFFKILVKKSNFLWKDLGYQFDVFEQ